MVTTKSALETGASRSFPKSRRVYVKGKHVSVPMREIDQSPTLNLAGESEPNEPVRVYDTSGPWGDPAHSCSVEEGLPALRSDWVLGRGDVEEIDGRTKRPEDDGFLSSRHAEQSPGTGRNQHRDFPGLRRKPLRAKDHPVTQLWYARQGIVTPEMEFIAIR